MFQIPNPTVSRTSDIKSTPTLESRPTLILSENSTNYNMMSHSTKESLKFNHEEFWKQKETPTKNLKKNYHEKLFPRKLNLSTDVKNLFLSEDCQQTPLRKYELGKENILPTQSSYTPCHSKVMSELTDNAIVKENHEESTNKKMRFMQSEDFLQTPTFRGNFVPPSPEHTQNGYRRKDQHCINPEANKTFSSFTLNDYRSIKQQYSTPDPHKTFATSALRDNRGMDQQYTTPDPHELLASTSMNDNKIIGQQYITPEAHRPLATSTMKPEYASNIFIKDLISERIPSTHDKHISSASMLDMEYENLTGDKDISANLSYRQSKPGQHFYQMHENIIDEAACTDAQMNYSTKTHLIKQDTRRTHQHNKDTNFIGLKVFSQPSMSFHNDQMENCRYVHLPLEFNANKAKIVDRSKQPNREN